MIGVSVDYLIFASQVDCKANRNATRAYTQPRKFWA